MKINKVRLQNYRCFADLNVSIETSVVLILGSNGSGKTSILDGIAAALGGLGESLQVPLLAPMSHGDVRRVLRAVGGSAVGTSHYPVRAEVQLSLAPSAAVGRGRDASDGVSFRELEEGKVWLRRPTADSVVRQWFRRRFEESKRSDGDSWPVIGYYRVGRNQRRSRTENVVDSLATHGIGRDGEESQRLFRLEQKAAVQAEDNFELERFGISQHSVPDRREGWRLALDAAADWKSTRDWWALEYLSAAAEGRPVSPLCRVVEQAVGIALGSKSQLPRWSASERDIVLCLPDGGLQPIGSLSDGYRTAVALFADLARRCAVLNPHLGGKAAECTPGVVLVDEVDLHLHPAWQRAIVPSLVTAFPMIQFVLTTHSPQVVGGVGRECVKVLDSNRMLNPVSDYTEGRDTNSILESIFGEPSRRHATREELRELFRAIDKSDLQRATQILSSLAVLLGEDDADLVRARWLMEMDGEDPAVE